MRQRSRVSIFCWSTNFNLNDHTVAHFEIFRLLNAHSNRHKISTIFGEQGSLTFSFANPYVDWDYPQPYVTLAEIAFKSRLGSSGMATKRKGAGPRQWKISPLNSKIIVTVYRTPVGKMVVAKHPASQSERGLCFGAEKSQSHAKRNA